MSTNMSQKKDNIEWRRNKVQELLVKGYNHYEIATILQISRSTITRDIQYLNECAKQNMEYSTKYTDYGNGNGTAKTKDVSSSSCFIVVVAKRLLL